MLPATATCPLSLSLAVLPGTGAGASPPLHHMLRRSFVLLSSNKTRVQFLAGGTSHHTALFPRRVCGECMLSRVRGEVGRMATWAGAKFRLTGLSACGPHGGRWRSATRDHTMGTLTAALCTAPSCSCACPGWRFPAACGPPATEARPGVTQRRATLRRRAACEHTHAAECASPMAAGRPPTSTRRGGVGGTAPT